MTLLGYGLAAICLVALGLLVWIALTPYEVPVW